MLISFWGQAVESLHRFPSLALKSRIDAAEWSLSLISAGAGGVGHLCVRASVSLWRTCSDRVSQRRVAIEVAGLAVMGEAQRRT